MLIVMVLLTNSGERFFRTTANFLGLSAADIDKIKNAWVGVYSTGYSGGGFGGGGGNAW